jgi:hypothetical protein
LGLLIEQLFKAPLQGRTFFRRQASGNGGSDGGHRRAGFHYFFGNNATPALFKTKASLEAATASGKENAFVFMAGIRARLR